MSIIILFYFFAPFIINAQVLEQYNSFEKTTYIDNLDQRMIPEIFKKIYYSKITEKAFKIQEQEIDTLSRYRNIYIYTPKAKNGYLFINKKITTKIMQCRCYSKELTVSYVINTKSVSTKEQIYRLLKLKKQEIVAMDISWDEQLFLLTVNIFTK